MVHGECIRNHLALLFYRDGGPARTRQYVGTHTIPVDKQFKGIVGSRRTTQHLAATCTVHSFFERDGGPARGWQHVGTPAVPVKNRCNVIAPPRAWSNILPQSAPCTASLRGMVGLRAAGNMWAPPPSLSRIDAT